MLTAHRSRKLQSWGCWSTGGARLRLGLGLDLRYLGGGGIAIDGIGARGGGNA